MSKTAHFVLKIVAGALALAAFVCLVLGFWNELTGAVGKLKHCCCRKSEYDDYADEELYAH